MNKVQVATNVFASRLKATGLLVCLLLIPQVPAANIHEAAETGDVETVRQILAADSNAWNTKDHYFHESPFGLAAGGGHLDIIKLFVANGFSLTESDGEWSRAIQGYDDEGNPTPLNEGQRSILQWGLQQTGDLDSYWFSSTLVGVV
ncbi:MAG: hypothetical protein HKN70_02075, partial [Gammaproteobacteria bacterium]|nr:hypothetical protein [Gammaproteobacteria bacterium]